MKGVLGGEGGGREAAFPIHAIHAIYATVYYVIGGA